MRDWQLHDQYVTKLYGDIYPQPEDEGHSRLAKKVIDFWMARMPTCKSVLDVGCGVGFCQPFFKRWNVNYTGVCLGEDFIAAKNIGRNVQKMDFNFLEFEDKSFDMVFSRHSLEHSPMPLLSLMEWLRVARSWLGLIVPTPEWYGYAGRNHYYVLNMEQWKNLLDCAGWNVLWADVDSLPFVGVDDSTKKPHEYWIMCEKKVLR